MPAVPVLPLTPALVRSYAGQAVVKAIHSAGVVSNYAWRVSQCRVTSIRGGQCRFTLTVPNPLTTCKGTVMIRVNGAKIQYRLNTKECS